LPLNQRNLPTSGKVKEENYTSDISKCLHVF
jgi:hypothetical protein